MNQKMQNKLANIHILLMDGDHEIAKIIWQVLVSFGFQKITYASNGRKGLDIVKNESVDLVVTDWDMDELSGIDFIRHIRMADNSPNRTLPIIMLTGKAQRKHVEEARDAGITEFLIKPFTAKSICQRLRLVIDNPRNFVMSADYVGPDRRRNKQQNIYSGDDRRTSSIKPQAPSTIVTIPKNNNDTTILKREYPIKNKIGADVSIAELFSEQNISSAQQLIEDSSDAFLRWLSDDIRRLENAFDKITSYPNHNYTNIQDVAGALLIIKSRAGTFGYQLTTDIAEMGYNLIADYNKLEPKRIEALRVHIDAIYITIDQATKKERCDKTVEKEILDTLKQLNNQIKAA